MTLARGVIVGMLVLLAGCVSVAPVSQQVAPHGERQVSERSYTIGVEQTSVVGDPVVRLKRYTLRAVVSSTYTVSESCRVRMALRYDHTFAPGDAVPLLGDSPCDEGTCRLIRLDDSALQGDLGALILPDGRLAARPIDLRTRAKQIGSIHAEPESCRFVPTSASEQRAEPGPNYRNFEILYGGIDGQTIRFTYREYSPDDLARPAYSQAFGYPLGSERVKFKDVSLRVVEARPDALRYVVEADGE